MVLETKRLVLRITRAMTHVISLALVSYIALFFVVLGLGFFQNAQTYPFLNAVIQVEQTVEAPAVKLIRASLPHTFQGIDLAPFIFILIVFLLWVTMEVQRSRLGLYGEILQREMKVQVRKKAHALQRNDRLASQKHEIKRIEAEAKAQAERATQESVRLEAAAVAQRKADEQAQRQATLDSEAQERKQSVQSTTPRTLPPMPHGVASEASSREELMEMMAQAKRRLEESKKNLSFLSIDVVDSTGMKIGEEPAIAERDFRQYKKLVVRAIADNNGLKAAWTPDGVMICFSTAEAAVSAAKQVINDLKHFNTEIKAMRTDFKVRCGINAGDVLFDDTVPMEEMSDRSIDIAGHMQKYADENTIYIGKHVIEEMSCSSNLDFEPASTEVDGCEVYSWHNTVG